MADSDDDYDRRRGRDKFKRERNDYDRREERGHRENWEDRRGMRGNYGNRQSVRSREIWNQSRNQRDRREGYSGRDQYEGRRRERFSPPGGGRPDMGHQAKRMRRDWDGDGGGYQHFDGPFGGRGGGHPGMGDHRRHAWGHGAAPDMNNLPPHRDFTVTVGGPGRGDNPDFLTQPPMLTFKLFLSQQDDTIGEEDAIKKFNEYKLDFKRQQISEFFLQHKEEEWFKARFHPEEHAKRQGELRAAMRQRLAVFTWLGEAGRLDNMALDVDHYDDILKVLDAAVIKMEGGTDLDLTILDEPQDEGRDDGSRSRTTSENVVETKTPEKKKEESKESPEDGEIKKEGEKKEGEKKEEEKKEGEGAEDKDKAADKPLEMAITPEQEELQRKAKEYQQQQKEQMQQQKRQGRKRKKTQREKSEYSYESEESESDSGSESDMEPAPPGLEDEPLPPGIEAGAPTATPSPAASAAPTSNGDAAPSDKGDAADKDAAPKKEGKEDGEAEEEKDVNTRPEVEEVPTRPRPLHRTQSIFLRNLAPTITKQEVEALCRRYPGFMRVALQDPQPERCFFRRGWATFSKKVNIKDICWNLNNIRLRDCELGATLNRELKLRVRPVNGLTVHKVVARNDIKLAARIIQNQDRKWGLWTDEEEEKKDQEKDVVFSFVSKNPVLHNITDYLVEEGSFEEEELLGTTEDEKKDSNNEITVERDENMLKVLDRMIMYLRVVHSIDYYSANEYPNEDEMPHRCGIMHGRGMPPGATAKITQTDMTEYQTTFENKLKTFLDTHIVLKEEDAAKLGKKNPEIEVEKFVQANTQELGKDKWLCPLSGKKFKGPDFVRKHVFNKHGEKVEEVKKEVVFFNNYLMDPKRPSLPEHPGNRPPPPRPEAPPAPAPPAQAPAAAAGFAGRPPAMAYGGGPPGFGGPSYGGRDSRDFGGRRGGNRGYGRRSDPRPIIEYRDLDAPDEMDIF